VDQIELAIFANMDPVVTLTTDPANLIASIKPTPLFHDTAPYASGCGKLDRFSMLRPKLKQPIALYRKATLSSHINTV
jgi:hypothetical protein